MEANAYIRELARRGQLSHAFLLLGTDGKALRETALLAAQALLCAAPDGEKPCGRCVHCKKLKKGIHPDLITTERLKDKREVLVDQIRELRQEAYVLPNEAARKVFLIPEADTMNAAAQNAFLKVLEEPPPYAAFLLLGKTPGAFLETVRSRCTELRVQAKAAEAEPSEEACALAEAFISGDRLAFLRTAFRCEKYERERFDRLLNELFRAAALRAKTADGEKREAAIALCGYAEALRERRKVNVSPGHCLGWLSTMMEERTAARPAAMEL